MDIDSSAGTFTTIVIIEYKIILCGADSHLKAIRSHLPKSCRSSGRPTGGVRRPCYTTGTRSGSVYRWHSSAGTLSQVDGTTLPYGGRNALACPVNRLRGGSSDDIVERHRIGNTVSVAVNNGKVSRVGRSNHCSAGSIDGASGITGGAGRTELQHQVFARLNGDIRQHPYLAGSIGLEDDDGVSFHIGRIVATVGQFYCESGGGIHPRRHGIRGTGICAVDLHLGNLDQRQVALLRNIECCIGIERRGVEHWTVVELGRVIHRMVPRNTRPLLAAVTRSVVTNRP